jgi:hypothetical protein
MFTIPKTKQICLDGYLKAAMGSAEDYSPTHFARTNAKTPITLAEL